MADRRSYRDVQPVQDLVTEEEAYEALVFLDQSPHDIAVAYARVDYCAALVKQTEAVGAQLSEEKANDRRLWDARSSDSYTKAIERLRDAQQAWMELKLKREAATIRVELFRTIRADKRARDVPQDRR